MIKSWQHIAVIESIQAQFSNDFNVIFIMFADPREILALMHMNTHQALIAQKFESGSSSKGQ